LYLQALWLDLVIMLMTILKNWKKKE